MILKNSKVVSFLSPFKVGQAGNLWTLPRKHNHTEWKIHKLSGACYAVRSLIHVGNTNTFKSIYVGYSDSKYQMCMSLAHPRDCHLRFITRSVKCMVTMRWVMAWLGSGFECSVKDERTCTMRREEDVHLWWIMIWCVRSTKECVTTDVSQFLICPCTFVRFQGLYSMTLSLVANIAGGRILWGVIQKLVSRYDKCLNNGGEYMEK